RSNSMKPRRRSNPLVPAIAALLAGMAAYAWQARAQQPMGIETAPLTQLDGWRVGALSRSQGALPQSLWRSADPVALGAMFDRLPAVFESPAAQALARRALLSGGQAPEGEGVLEAMRKRYSALGRMGFADDLSVISGAAGPSASDPAIAQYAAQAELARNRRTEACARGRFAQAEEPPAFLLRLRAYCAAAIGERAAADLALELARSAGAEDAWFRTAIAGVGEGAPRPRVAAKYDSSLNAAVSLAANLRTPPNPLANSSTLSLGVLARTETTAQPLRAQAAALAYRRSAIPAAEARQILRAVPTTVTAGIPAIAVALRRVEAAPGSLDAAQAIAGVLRQSRTPADFAAAATFFSRDIAALTVAPDAESAILFARAALLANETDLAERLAANAAQANANQLSLAVTRSAIAAAKGDMNIAVLRTRIEAAPATGQRAAARDAAIFAALGYELDAGAQAFFVAAAPQGGTAADAGVLAALAAAAQRGSTGEVAILASAAAAPGMQTLNSASQIAIIRALRDASLNDAARSFAVEAILFGAQT
ncbi:MAG: hypothetical protein ABW199_03415, partial [Caulobacterales bacterium]